MSVLKPSLILDSGAVLAGILSAADLLPALWLCSLLLYDNETSHGVLVLLYRLGGLAEPLSDAAKEAFDLCEQCVSSLVGYIEAQCKVQKQLMDVEKSRCGGRRRRLGSCLGSRQSSCCRRCRRRHCKVQPQLPTVDAGKPIKSPSAVHAHASSPPAQVAALEERISI